MCFLCWPDAPEATARRHLSHLLTHLRRALPSPDLLLVAADQVALYRGPLLAGFSRPDSAEFGMWARLERRTQETLYLKALVALVEEQTARGEYATAIAYARRYLETDDLAEDMHRRLIELYAATGDRGAALRQFERCTAILERELGINPLPETRAAYRAALEGRRTRPQPLLAGTTWTTLPSLDTPLVGREEALGWLQRAYADARSGHGGVILISGEAGIGKSRLMQEFAASLAGHPLVLTGACYPGAPTAPYQPIVQALRSLLGHDDAEGSGREDIRLTSPLPLSISSVWLAEAARLLPELRALYPDLPPLVSEPPEAQERLFERMAPTKSLQWSPTSTCRPRWNTTAHETRRADDRPLSSEIDSVPKGGHLSPTTGLRMPSLHPSEL